MSNHDSPPASSDRDGVAGAEPGDGSETGDAASLRESIGVDRARDRIGAGADRAVAELDRGVVGVLARALAAETRARVYAALRDRPTATVAEVADDVDRYPADVREALADLRDAGAVRRADPDRSEDGDGRGADAAYRAVPPRSIARERAPTPSPVSESDDAVRIPVEGPESDRAGRLG